MEKFKSFRKGAIAALSAVFCLSLGVACAYSTGVSAKAESDNGAIMGMNVVLSDSIAAKFSVDEKLAGAGAYLTVEFNGKTETITEGASNNGVTTYEFTGITPQYMVEDMVATVYTAEGVSAGTVTTSIQDYCVSLLGKTADELDYSANKYSAMTTLVNDLLNYGTAAQEYKFDTVENPANGVLDNPTYGEQAFPAQSNKSATLNGEEATANYAVPVAATMELDYNINMVFKYNVTDDVINANFALTNNGEVVDATAYEVEKVAGANYNTIIKYAIPATQLDNVITVAVADGETAVGYKATYSVADYVYAKMNGAEQGDLVKKMYVYGTSAKAFSEIECYKITLVGGYFGEDKNDNVHYLDRGATTVNLPKVSLTDEYKKDGKVLNQWYYTYGYYYNANLSDVYKLGNDKNQSSSSYTLRPIYEAEKIIVGRSNTTDNPYTNAEYYSGKVDMRHANKMQCFAIDKDGATVSRPPVSGTGSASYNNHSLIFGNDYGERADLIRTSGAVTAGTHFAEMYDVAWRGAGATKVTITIKNMSGQPLDFTTFLSTSAGATLTDATAKAAKAIETKKSDTVLSWKLASSEVKTQTFTTSDHNCIILNYVINTDLAKRFDINLTMYLDYSKTLTVESDYFTFADGSKTAKVDYRNTTAAPVGALPAGYNLLGWNIKGNVDKLYAPDLSDFVMPGNDTTIVPVTDEPIVLTLQGAKFSDGTNVMPLEVGEKMPAGIVVEIPEDYIHVGWVDVSNLSVLTTENAWTMPNKPTTLAPVFDRAAYGTDGYTTTYHAPDKSGVKTVAGAKLSSTVFNQDSGKVDSDISVKDGTAAILTEGGFYELAIRMYCGDTFDTYSVEELNAISNVANLDASTADFWFARWGQNTWPKSTIYTTWINYGSETISFRVYWATSSDQWVNNNSYLDITLEAGETKEFTWNGTARDSFMMGMVFISEDGTTTYNGISVGFIAYNS